MCVLNWRFFFSFGDHYIWYILSRGRTELIEFTFGFKLSYAPDCIILYYIIHIDRYIWHWHIGKRAH